MLNFKYIGLITLFCVVFILISFYFGNLNLGFILVPIFFYLLLLIYGSICIKCNYYLKSINQLIDNKAVLITFDDGPDPEITPQILKLLDEYDRKAIFFIIGKKALKFPDLVKAIHQKGHIIGNHSFWHSFFFPFKSSNKMVDEMKNASEIIYKIIGEKPLYFRPPFGVTNPNLKKALQISQMQSIGWTFRSFDTGRQSSHQIVARLMNKIKGGEILLFHDNRAKSLDILKEFMPFLIKFEQGVI